MNTLSGCILVVCVCALLSCKSEPSHLVVSDGITMDPALRMVPVAGGTFNAESTTVTLSDFSIDKYEVTFEFWQEVRIWGNIRGYPGFPSGSKGYLTGDSANMPVVGVTWYDVLRWCNARSEREGLRPVYYIPGDSAHRIVNRTGEYNLDNAAVDWNADGYRLPTEAEWEYAARGGALSHGYAYSGGNAIDSVGWYVGNSFNQAHPVGRKSPNELGIYDMTGNVNEWCWDCGNASFPSGGTKDPKGSSSIGLYRVYRGGAYNEGAGVGITVFRTYRFQWPSVSSDAMGFRCVRKR